jgi:hypothetical protein
MSEKVRKVGLNHFLCRKKCGKLDQALSNIKNDKVLFSEFILTTKYCKDYFPNFSAIKNDKVQLSASFSAIKNDKVQLSGGNLNFVIFHVGKSAESWT